jgi:hypothetical protein
MSNKNSTHCAFFAILEVQESPSDSKSASISLKALAQDIAYEGIPSLQSSESISVRVEYYNSFKQTFQPNAVIVCHGLLWVEEHSSGLPTITVKANTLIAYSTLPGF